MTTKVKSETLCLVQYKCWLCTATVTTFCKSTNTINTISILWIHETFEHRRAVDFNGGQQAKINEFSHDDESSNVLIFYICVENVDRENRDEEGIFDNETIELTKKCASVFCIPLPNIFLFHEFGDASVVVFVPA